MRNRLDFSAVVGNMVQRGYSQRAIARHTGVAVSTVNRWYLGIASPRFDAGDRLMFFAATLEPEAEKPPETV